MNKKLFFGLICFMVFGTAQATSVPWTGSFSFYYCCTGIQIDANDDGPGLDAYVTGLIDIAAGTFTLESSDTMYGIPWTASNGILFGPGTHTVSTVDSVGASGGDITFTVDSGQLGGWLKWDWNNTSNMDVVLVWDVTSANGITSYISTDWDSDGVPGGQIIDGTVVGSNASFNMSQVIVPLPSALYFFISGILGLAGLMQRRIRRCPA